MIRKTAIVAALVLGLSVPVAAQEAPATPLAIDAESIKAADLPTPPVIAGDISDRPYTVVGQITAGVRKATIFSKSASREKVYRELWERGKKMGADAVVHASYGDSTVSAMSWGQRNATGIAIKFDAPPAVLP